MASRRITRRPSRLFTAFLILVVLACVAWQVAERLIDVDRYRPQVETLLGQYLGLPVLVQRLDLALLPVPRLEATGITLGEGDFHAEAPTLIAYADLRRLRDYRIEITQVMLAGLRVGVPEDPDVLADRLSSLGPPAERPSAPQTSGPPKVGSFEVVIDRILANGDIYRGARTTPTLAFNVEVRDPLARQILVAVSSAMPDYGKRARLTAQFAVTPGANPDVQGTAEVEGVNLQAAFPSADLPESMGRLDAQIETPKSDLIAIDLSGGVSAPASEVLSGTFAAKAWWDDGSVVVNDAEWHSRDVAVKGNVTRSPEGAYACEAPYVRIGEAALAWFADWRKPPNATPLLAKDASVSGDDLLFGVDPEGALRLVRGTVTCQGLGLALEDGAEAVRDVHGHLDIDEGVIRIEELAGDGFTLRGSVTPDFATRKAAVNLSGKATLNRAQLAPFMRLDDVTELAGEVTIENLAGTFSADGVVPDDLVVEGRLREGRVAVATADFKDVFGPVTATFTTGPEEIVSDIAAESGKLGALRAKGRYRFSEHAWAGNVTLDIGRAGEPFYGGDERARELIEPVLASFGLSTLDVTVAVPTDDSPDVNIVAERQGAPALAGRLSVVRTEAGTGLGTVRATADVSLAALEGVLPPKITAEGVAKVELNRVPNDEQFTAVADVTDCVLTAGPRIRKQAGDPASVRLAGDAVQFDWTPRTLTATYRGQDVPMRIADNRLVAEGLDVDLASFAPLLPDGARVSGRIAGGFATEPFAADLRLADVAFDLSPELVVDSLNGPVTCNDGTWQCAGLAFRGAHSDGVLDARWRPDDWRAELKAGQVDANALDAWITAMKEYTGAAPVEETPPSTTFTGSFFDKPYASGQLDVDAKTFLFRRGQVEGVRAAVTLNEKGLFIKDLSLRPYTGLVSGSIAIPKPAVGAMPYADVDLRLDAIDLRILDEWVSTTPRYFHGTLSGAINLHCPSGHGASLIDDATGTIAFTATDGSFGQLGFATKILAALKTLEVFRLRMPSFKDEGLTYNICRGTLGVEHGVVQIQDLMLESSPLVMQAGGLIDFPRRASDVEVRASLLEGITGLMDHVPGLSRAADKVRYHASVVLAVQGPPDDPTVRLAPDERINDLADGLKGAAKTGEEVLVERPADALKRLLKR